jgi:hypothetical protein
MQDTNVACMASINHVDPLALVFRLLRESGGSQAETY